MIPLTATANIATLNEGDIYIHILHMSENNYRGTLYTQDESITYEVEIFNHTGNQLELIGKVIDGWTMRRKD